MAEQWPKDKGSVIPSNIWETDFAAFAKLLTDNQDLNFWTEDWELKYLEMRLDTRDNAFILRSRDGKRIDPQRVVDAIAKRKAREF